MILLLWWGALDQAEINAAPRAGPLRFADRIAAGWQAEFRAGKAMAFGAAGQACVLASIRGNDAIYESADTLQGYVGTIRTRYANQQALETGLTGAGLAQWHDKRVRSLKFHERRVLNSSTRQAPSPHRQAVVLDELALIAEKLSALEG